MAEPIKARNYTCYSPACEGQIKGLDKVPKMYGRAAECWCCGSDLYTLPRFGAPTTAVVGRPGVTANMLQTSSATSNINPAGWFQSFQGLLVTRPAGQRD